MGTRLAWISPSREGTGTCVVNSGRGKTATVVILRAFYKSGHNKRHVHATTVGTILRPIGRPCANIMAPLSCAVRPPQPRRRRRCRTTTPRGCTRPLPSAVLLAVSSSYPFIFRPPSALVCPPRRPPLNSPGVLAGVSSSLLDHPRSSFSPDVVAARATLRVSVVAPRRFQRVTRVQRRVSGAHRWLLPFTLKGLGRDAEDSFSRERALPFFLASLLSSSHPTPLSPFCARRGSNRVQLKLRSRAHRPR